jgi:formate dehydrogenase maturation protein FdhE
VKQSINIATIFPKHLFWDMDYSKLNLSRDKDIIIPRALFATTEETFETDIQKLEELYSAKDIVKYLKLTTENISNKVCISVAKRYNVKPFHRFSL